MCNQTSEHGWTCRYQWELQLSSQEETMHMGPPLPLRGAMHMFHPAILQLLLAKVQWPIEQMTALLESRIICLRFSKVCQTYASIEPVRIDELLC